MSNSLLNRSQQIDETIKKASDAFFGEASFGKSIVVAKSINDLRELLDEAVMNDVMKLMNTPLGFQTDQDPKRPSQSNPTPKPYPVEVVKECFIEASLRGFYPVNNEFNIIAGRFYGALNGFERLVRKHPRVTDFKERIEVPRVAGENGALVKCHATWKQAGVKQEIDQEFAVRINRGMGTDAIVGKAKRKLFAMIFARLSGVVTPDGDIDVESLKSAKPADDVKPAEEKTPGDLFKKK